jgi:hypothetical protein
MFATQYLVRFAKALFGLLLAGLVGSCGTQHNSQSLFVSSSDSCASALPSLLANYESGKVGLLGTLSYDQNFVSWFSQNKNRIFIHTKGPDPITEEFIDRQEFWDGAYLYSPYPDPSKNFTVVDDAKILPIWEYLSSTNDECTVQKKGVGSVFLVDKVDQNGEKHAYRIVIQAVSIDSPDPWTTNSSAPECQISGVKIVGPKRDIAACPSEIVFR